MDTFQDDLIDAIELLQQKQLLREFLNTLSWFDKLVICQYFGIDQEKRTLLQMVKNRNMTQKELLIRIERIVDHLVLMKNTRYGIVDELTQYNRHMNKKY